MMATVSLNYLQIGPRQGVYISPLRWRQTQFRPPETGYQFRARVEPHPASTGFPARIIRRQFPFKPAAGGSSSLNSSKSNPSLTSPKKCPKVVNRQLSEDSQRGKEGLACSLTAHAVVMRPRPPQRPPPAVTRAGSILTSQETFSYPDPTKIKGNIAFDLRLVELARLESDTVRYEELRSRMMSRPNRPSSPHDRRPSSAKSARSSSKAVPQSCSRASLAGSMDQDKRLGTAPLLNRKTSCPSVLSTSMNGRSNFRPASSYCTIRESRSATPAVQRSRAHLSHSRSDEQASTHTWQRPQCSPDTESENCSQSEYLRSPSVTPRIAVTDEETSLQNETESRKLDESEAVNEGDLQVCSVTDLDGLPPSAGERPSSSDQKNVETNEKATQTSASKRKGSKTHSSKKLTVSAELRSDSGPRLDNLLDSSSECSLRSTKSAKSKKRRSPVSRKSHSTHAPRRTK